MTKNYEFRTLNSKDLFLIIKLVKKIGLDNLSKVLDNEHIKDIVNQFINVEVTESDNTQNDNAENKSNENDAKFLQIGMAIMLEVGQVIIERLDACENELYDLLEATSNIKKKELYTMDMDVFIGMVIEFVQKEDFQRAFQKVVSLFK